MQLVGPAAVIILIVLIAFGCQKYSEPETALRAYAAAVRERRCGDSLEFLSTKTRYAVDALRQKPQHPHDPPPIEEYYCSKFAFEHCKLDELTVQQIEGDTATIAMTCGRTQDGFIPGFTSMFLKYEPRSFELVREDGRWGVVLPYVIRIVEVRESEDLLREKILEEYKIILEQKAKKDSR